MSILQVITVLAGLFQLSRSICTVSCPLCPCFATAEETLSVPENVAVGSTVYTFSAMDVRGLDLTYSIRTPPTPADHFVLDAMTGVLAVGRELDYETTPMYVFTVAVVNSVGDRDSIRVIIELINVDDNPTNCSESIVFLSVVEEQLAAELQLPTCTDVDIPTSPSFDYLIIAGNETGLFTITNGSISLLRALDYETQTLHDLSVIAVQSGGSLSYNITVIIEVLPVNEYTPQFASTRIDLVVPESALISSSIGNVSATDGDSGIDGMIVYSILSQSSNAFTIHPNTGEVIVTRQLDYETMPSHYELIVIARDNPSGEGIQRSSTAQVRISIEDVNDNRPFFTSYVYYREVSEQSYSVGREVAHLQCNDLDSGLNQEVTYQIVIGNQEGKFGINSTSGQVTLLSALNYEGNNTQLYNLTVECTEVQPPHGIAQSSLLVSVGSFNEFNPDPGADYRATLSEDTPPGTMVIRIQGRDRDRGPAGVLTYFINEDNTQFCPSNIFFIDRYTGIVYLNSPLDYETGLRTIYCPVTVRDSELPTRQAEADLIVTVSNVNDEPPVCDPPMFSTSVAEDSMIGDDVLTLSCRDGDSQILSYSIIGELNIPFQISSTGILTVDGALDYETDSSFHIPIEVSDGEYSFNTTVFLSVAGINEHAPVFAQAVYVCSVDENSAVGTLICTVSASDDDSGMDGVLRYQLSSGSSNVTISVDTTTGGIYLSRRVDYESESSFTFVIEAYDLGDPSLTGSASVRIDVVDLNDNPPQMDTFVLLTVSENTALGETVGTLECTDSDAGSNGLVSYHLNNIVRVSDNGTEIPTVGTLFILDSTTGTITVNGGLDYESDQQYRLSVICRDNGSPSLATFSNVMVVVEAENEFVPSFSQSEYSVDVSENTTIGSSIIVVSALDGDGGAQGDIVYSIQELSSQPFSINPDSGVVSLNSQLDCLQNLSYLLTVVAQDRGRPPLQSQTAVLVNVVHCHLGELVPEQSVYVASVYENSPPGAAILTVACTSTRSSLGLSYTPKYRISRDDASLFQVGEESGLLSVSTSPDFESETFHLIHMQCFDENYPEVTAVIFAYVSVNPLNEYDPEFSENPYTFSVEEGTTLGSLVFTVVASDSDSGRDGEIAYLLSGTDSHYFFINEYTGDVYLAETLDRESKAELTLLVSASDNPDNVSVRRSTFSTVIVEVADSNDHWPQCNRTVYHFIVSPKTEPGSVILRDLGCFDVDLGLNGELRYELDERGYEGTLFAIDRYNGSITLLDSLDPEESASHHITIVVYDLGSPSLAMYLLVVIDVQEPPLFNDGSLGDGNGDFLEEDEGLKNAVTIVLEDIPFELWNTTEPQEKFQEIVADSVTKYCALLPEACSLVTGCAQFYGIRSRRSIDSYANFIQADVTVIPNHTTEVSAASVQSESDTSNLLVSFYVVLPSGAERAPYRETNYVVPKATLSEIVNQDGGVIQAVVRNSLSPPLTASVEPIADSWKSVGIAFICITIIVLCVVVLVVLRKAISVIKAKKSNRVIPIKKDSDKRKKVVNRKIGHSSKPTPSAFFKKSNKELTSMTLRQPSPITSRIMSTSFNNINSVRTSESSERSTYTSTSSRLPQIGPNDGSTLNSSQSYTSGSSLSRISLDNDRASMENNASTKSRRSTASELEVSSPSDLGDSRGSRGSGPGSDDYLENFPYAPPSRKPIPRHIASIWSMKQ